MDLFTVVALAVMLLIIFLLVKRLLFMLRHLRNSFRGFTGKAPAEAEAAWNILNTHVKNGLIPKFACDDAIHELSKYYSKESAINSVADQLNSNGVRYLEVPRSLYVKPGAERVKLMQLCDAQFDKFNRKILTDQTALSKKESAAFDHLVAMWYFADDTVSTMSEARQQMNFVFQAYIVKETGVVPNTSTVE